MAVLEIQSSFGSARNRPFIFVDYTVKLKLAAVIVGHFHLIVKTKKSLKNDAENKKS